MWVASLRFAYDDSYFFGRVLGSAAWKTILLWLPSQKGLLAEAPQRQSEMPGLPVRSKSVPSMSTRETDSDKAGRPSTRRGPLGLMLIFTAVSDIQGRSWKMGFSTVSLSAWVGGARTNSVRSVLRSAE